MNIPKIGPAVDVGFIYERFPISTLEHTLKCGILFFDKLALKADGNELRGQINDYLVNPMRDADLLRLIDPSEIMTEAALDWQNKVILDLLNDGAFDYLGKNPYWHDYATLSASPLAFMNYATDKHRAFLSPVAEELMRRKLAVPIGVKVPAKTRQRLEAKGKRGTGGQRPWFYEGPLGRKTRTKQATNGTAFPYFWTVVNDRVPVEFEGKSFIHLAVHRDIAFAHSEIVRTIAYSSSTPGAKYHAFTPMPDRQRVKQFLGMLPGSAYSEIVMTDLEQISIDLHAVPLNELTAFRDENRSGFIEYRNSLATTITELSQCSDVNEREAALLRRQEELAVLARELKRACRQAFGIRLGSSAVGAVGMVWSSMHGDPVSAMISATSAILGVKSVSEPTSHIRYLYDIQGKLSPGGSWVTSEQ